ncbi:MAG: DHH family phosphoesterase, partial [Clostridia bacterium]|nr:DHH family phosphoesterase [Clostridia bacterium]
MIRMTNPSTEIRNNTVSRRGKNASALHGELKKKIIGAQSVALLMHTSPDGDTCGSALALYRGCVLLGKEAVVVCGHAVPHVYRGLYGADQVMSPDAVKGRVFDLAIAVDAGDRGRLGQCDSLFDDAVYTAQIDHHETNPSYAQVNVIRSPLSATGVLAAEVLDSLAIPMDRQIAECLYVAVATDTGNFAQQNTDEAAFVLAARCVAAGIPLNALANRIFNEKPLCRGRLLGRALSSMEMLENGKIAIMSLRLADFSECGALSEHTEGIIDYARYTEGVRLSCLLVEKRDHVKCSFRAGTPYDVARV